MRTQSVVESLSIAFMPFGILKAVNLDIDPLTGRHKGYAYVEYDLPEGAQLAIEQMCGVSLMGRPIRVGRPTNTDTYQEPVEIFNARMSLFIFTIVFQHGPKEIIDATIEKSKTRAILYVSNIHPKIVEDDLRMIFAPFGDVKKAVLIKDYVTGKHKSYGFVEYTTVKAAADATESMNLFELNGKQIRVGRAMFPPPQIINSGPETNFIRTSSAKVDRQKEYCIVIFC